MKNIYLIFRRDYFGYVSAWGFWLGLLALPLLASLGIVFMSLASSTTPTRYYAVIEQGSVYADAIDAEFERAQSDAAEAAMAMTQQMNLPDNTTAAMNAQMDGAMGERKFINVPPPAETIDDLRPYLLGEVLVDGPLGPRPLFAVIVASPDESELAYWSEDVNVATLRSVTERAVSRLTRRNALKDVGLSEEFLKEVDAAAPRVLEHRIRSAEEQLSAGSAVTLSDRAPIFVAAGLAYILWLLIFSVIQYLLMGTIEERGNKIFDTLLTSVKLPELLAGKLLAVFAVTGTMMAAWGLTAVAGSVFAISAAPEMGQLIDPFIASLLNPAIMVPALISFVLGYLMYGVIFMALGSLCDTIQEAQTLLSPMMVLLMLPMLGILLGASDPGSPLIDIASWIPLFTPFLLILRMPHDPPMWEVMVQMGMMALTTAITLWLATKVYRAGAVNGAGISDIIGWAKGLFGRRKKEPAGE